MSPARKIIAPSNLYTAILAIATAVVFVALAFVAYKCWADYGTIFKIMEASR